MVLNVSTWCTLVRRFVSRFDVIERNLPGGVISELLIQNSSSSDTGAYTCQVSNKFGNATAHMKLFVLGSYTYITLYESRKQNRQEQCGIDLHKSFETTERGLLDIVGRP